jgi:hypothetical protein
MQCSCIVGDKVREIQEHLSMLKEQYNITHAKNDEGKILSRFKINTVLFFPQFFAKL